MLQVNTASTKQFLDDIKSHFCIAVDNPVMVLSQVCDKRTDKQTAPQWQRFA